MNHDLTHERIVDEFDSIWQAVSHLEDAAKDQLKQIEDIRRLIQDRLTQINIEEAHIAQETDIQVPRMANRR